MWEGLGLGERVAVGDWRRYKGSKNILLGIGGGHYVPRHMDIVLYMYVQFPDVAFMGLLKQ